MVLDTTEGEHLGAALVGGKGFGASIYETLWRTFGLPYKVKKSTADVILALGVYSLD